MPPTQSVGPALVKFGESLQEQQFAKQKDLLTQEAQQAAAKLNFERDGAGNLLAPTLPITEDGMLAPSIYDRAYTQMVSQRYLQQTKIDTSERLNLIATEHRFDPEGYRKVAEGYVKKVTELAPDMLKPDVNNTAQIRMVEHYNHIINKKAERDHKEAKEVHAMSLDEDYDELAGYTISGADEDILGTRMLAIRAKIEEGVALNYWNEAEADARIDLMDQKFALSAITRDINNLPNDEVEYELAKQDLLEFATGGGKIRMVDELGNIRNASVEDVYPNPEDRAAIADAAIGILNQKKAAYNSFRNAIDQRQSDNFYMWYLTHTLENIGSPLDMGELNYWFNEAVGQENTTLAKQIQKIILDQYGNEVENNGTRAQRHLMRSLLTLENKRSSAEAAYLERVGVERKEDLPPKQQAELDMALDNLGDVYAKQGEDLAENIEGVYAAMNGGNQVDFSTASLEQIEEYLSNGPGSVGVISQNMSIAVNQALESSNEDQLNRGLDIARLMYKHKSMRGNMTHSSALGRNGDALMEIFDNYSPSDIEGSKIREVLHKYSDPDYSPYLEWEKLDDADRMKIMEWTEGLLDDRYESYLANIFGQQGYEVPAMNLAPLTPELSSFPEEMKVQIFQELRTRAGYIDPKKPEKFMRHIDEAVNKVVREHGYVPSKLGWDKSRFEGVKERGWWWDTAPADYAWSQFAPEAFYRFGEAPMTNVLTAVEQDFQTLLTGMNKDDKNLPKLVAGDNAFLEYNPAATIRVNEGGRWRTIPRYNIRILNESYQGELATSDKYVYGDQFVIDFESSYQRGIEADTAIWKQKDKRAKQQREDLRTGRAFPEVRN